VSISFSSVEEKLKTNVEEENELYQ